MLLRRFSSFFFFNDTATTEIYTLSLHDALPICRRRTMNDPLRLPGPEQIGGRTGAGEVRSDGFGRGEVHRVLPIDPGDLVPVPLRGEQQVGSEESTHARNEDHRRSVRTNAPDEAASADLAYGALEQEDSASARDRGLRSDRTIAAHRPMPACAYAFS